MASLDTFIKRHDYLVCVDSDGCAMDTMDIKHHRCFGPCMVAEWGLQAWQDTILPRWNDINLYTMTRGINRFQGLRVALTEVDATLCPIEGVNTLAHWVDTSAALSNEALEQAVAADPAATVLQKALAWSRAVNAAIRALPQETVRPFPLAREALAFAHERADVAIVSSANAGAVQEEWSRHGLLPHTDIVLAQDAGSKAACIAALLAKGYTPDRVLMCGDAPGDRQAALKNGVYYYPILVRRERESWQEFMDTGLDRLLAGTYGGAYQEEKTQAFLANLGGTP